MNDLIQQYYPEPAFFTYLYLASFEQDYVENSKTINQDHLEPLETSGFIKIKDDQIILKEDGKWLCDPPEIKRREKKSREPFKNPRLDKLADLVGYPSDWHVRGKYERLLRISIKKHGWELLEKTANWWKDNKKSEELELGYFLSKGGFKGIVYQMNNPKKPKKENILSREQILAAQDDDEDWTW